MDEIIHNLSKIIAREMVRVSNEALMPGGSPDTSDEIISAGRVNIAELRDLREKLENIRVRLVSGGNV